MSGKRKSDISFDIFNYIVLTVFLIMVAYPIYFMFIASISDPNAVNLGLVTLKPKNITLEGYRAILADENIWIGYRNSIFYAVFGTLISILVTITAAFALSRKELPGRMLIMYIIVFTMFFNGGMIPTYFVVRGLGLRDTVWSLLLPGAVATYYLIISRTFFQTTIPEELKESAFIDGASYFMFFTRIVLPVSKAIIAVMVLFYAVAQWNSFFSALLYISKKELYPLQLVLRDILVESEAASMTDDISAMAEKQRMVELVKYGVIIVASVPLLILYPFIQKYFVKGIMIGSVKG